MALPKLGFLLEGICGPSSFSDLGSHCSIDSYTLTNNKFKLTSEAAAATSDFLKYSLVEKELLHA